MIVGNGSTLRLLRPKLLQVKERMWSSFCYFITISSLLSATFFPLWEQLTSLHGHEICFFRERESADETLSKSAASAFCITAGHICSNYSSTWTAPGSQCSSEFVIFTLSLLEKIIVDWRMRVQYLLVGCRTFLGNLVLLCRKQEILQHVLKKKKSLPSAVGLLGMCQSIPLQKSITSCWCCHTVLYHKNMYTCNLMCFNHGFVFLFFSTDVYSASGVHGTVRKALSEFISFPLDFIILTALNINFD